MRHFAYLTDDERERLFAVPPGEVGPASPRGSLALALGATLYSPGTRTALDADAERAAADAQPEADAEPAEAHIAPGPMARATRFPVHR